MAELDKASVEKVLAKSKKVIMGMAIGAGIGARLHMEKVATRAKEEAPVKYGNLKGSGRAEGPIQDGLESESAVGFGAGVSASYAVPVHFKYNDFLARAEADLRGEAMPMIAKEAIKKMQEAAK